MRKLYATLAVASVLVTQATAVAADKDAVSDKEFLAKAMAGGMAEVQRGQLAEKQASNDRVKEFARRMVKDHTPVNEKLMEMARTMKGAVATGPEGEHKIARDKLSRLSGAEFDRAYMQHLVEDHEKAVALFEAQAKGGMNADLKAFTASALPTLQGHLKQARATNDSLQNQK
jgi:putative membrane protein